MDEDFDQECYSRTPRVVDKKGHNSIRLMEWGAYCEINYENIKKYLEVLASVSSVLIKELSLS